MLRRGSIGLRAAVITRIAPLPEAVRSAFPHRSGARAVSFALERSVDLQHNRLVVRRACRAVDLTAA